MSLLRMKFGGGYHTNSGSLIQVLQVAGKDTNFSVV